jgi:hypothetical protein
MQDIRDRLGSKEDSRKRKQSSEAVQLRESVEIGLKIDSSGQQSSEKRDGLVGSHRLEGRYTSS